MWRYFPFKVTGGTKLGLGSLVDRWSDYSDLRAVEMWATTTRCQEVYRTEHVIVYYQPPDMIYVWTDQELQEA